MADELYFVANSSGLSVSADLYLNGAYVTSQSLSSSTGGPNSTVYKANFPSGRAAGKYTVVYRIVGDSSLHGPDILWWNGSAEVSLVSIQNTLIAMLGSGFETGTDSLEAIRNAIASSGSGNTGSSGGLTQADRDQLTRIETSARAAEAGAIGDFVTDLTQNRGTLRNRDGSVAATFSLLDSGGQPSVNRAVQRNRLT